MQVPDATVYTVRVQTGRERASALDDGAAGVQLCMVGENKEALLHRIGQIEPEVSAQDTMDDICEVRPAPAHALQLCNLLMVPAVVVMDPYDGQPGTSRPHFVAGAMRLYLLVAIMQRRRLEELHTDCWPERRRCVRPQASQSSRHHAAAT